MVALLALPAATLGISGSALGVEPDGSGAPSLDARAGDPPVRPGPRTAAAQRELRGELGRLGVVRLDRRTGTPRVVARRDGFLTGRSGRGAAEVALRYVRRHARAFGLDADDLARVRPTFRRRFGAGIERVQFVQTFHDVPALEGGFAASVSADGRLLGLAGAPTPDLTGASTAPRLSAAEAGRAAVRATGRAGRVDGRPGLVLFEDPDGARLAWRVLVASSDGHYYDSVVDAASGRLLRRRDLLVHASGMAFRNYPGAAAGGTQQSVAFPTSGADPWLTTFDRLQGDNAVVYSDVDADLYTRTDASGEPTPQPALDDHVAPTSGGGTTSAAWSAAHTTQGAAGSGQECPPAGCSWNGFAPGFSWSVNRAQAATQLFYFTNVFHDHLRDDPGIGFDDSSGNFEEQASAGAASDPVHAQVDDGANLLSGFPDCNHVNNANISVLPDGRSPRIQMYLFTGACGDHGVHDVNSADDPFVVYHEYGHGLSGRLVTDSHGWWALDSDQAGAMGEAWSDWYAMDYLVEQGLETDTATHGNLPNTPYEGVPFRTQPLDCPVGTTAARCPGVGSGDPGGYTYGDFGEVIGYVQVHADGEIWAETLWDLRRRMLQAHPADGLFRTRAVVTDGMRLAPPEPSFLEMRDAILQAEAARGFGDSALVWEVFAARGMGACASTSGAMDGDPVEDFRTPASGCGGGGGAAVPQGEVAPAAPAAPSSPAPATNTPSGSPSTAKPSPPPVKITGGVVRVDRRGRFVYRLRTAPGSTGTLELRRSRGGAAKRRRVLLRRPFRARSNGRVTLALRLPRSLRALLRRHRRVHASLTVRATSRGLTSVGRRQLSLRLRG